MKRPASRPPSSLELTIIERGRQTLAHLFAAPPRTHARNDVPHDHGGCDARLVSPPPSSRSPVLPRCDLTRARSALLSTGARPLRRRHRASRVRWLCATPVRHACPPPILSRLLSTPSTPARLPLLRGGPPARLPACCSLRMPTPHDPFSCGSVVRRDGRQEEAQEEARQEAGA